MGAILSPIRIVITLPGLTSMRTLDPMSMRIHTGIIAPIITPIDGEVGHHKLLATAGLVRGCLSALQRCGV